MGVELVVATCLGAGLGYLSDAKLSTAPWLMVLGVLIGTVAGIRNMLRLSKQLGESKDR